MVRQSQKLNFDHICSYCILARTGQKMNEIQMYKDNYLQVIPILLLLSLLTNILYV